MVRTGTEATGALAMASTTQRLLPGQYNVAWQDGSDSMACRRDLALPAPKVHQPKEGKACKLCKCCVGSALLLW